MQLKVNGMQRIKTKTSKCGSVVEFKTSEGVLTVDDYTISADDQLARYLQQACDNIMNEGGEVNESHETNPTQKKPEIWIWLMGSFEAVPVIL